MSTWISRTFAVSAALATLTACVMDTGTGRSATILGGAVTIGAPAGYCVDRSAGSNTRDSAVVLMGKCSKAGTAHPALITVSVGTTDSAGVLNAGGPALAAFFTSPQGRAMLSRSGRAADVRVAGIVKMDHAYLIHVIDRRAGDHWRAVTSTAGRLVTISAIGAETPVLSPADSRRLVESTLQALQNANVGP